MRWISRMHAGQPSAGAPDTSGMQRPQPHPERGASENSAAQKSGATDIPHAVRPAPGLAVDIETTGLGPDCQLTCVCAWDGNIDGDSNSNCAKGEMWFFRTPEEFRCSKDAIIARLNATGLIYAYNGAHFDIPVLGRCLGHPIGPWMAKLVDPLYAARALLGSGFTMPLNAFLQLNSLPSKSGSGAHAVQLALEHRWGELGSYCMDDTRLTFDAIAGGNWSHGMRYSPWLKDKIFTTC